MICYYLTMLVLLRSLDPGTPLENLLVITEMCYKHKECIAILKKEIMVIIPQCFDNENDTAKFISMLSNINEFLATKERLFISVYAISRACQFKNLSEHHLIRVCHHGAKVINHALLKGLKPSEKLGA